MTFLIRRFLIHSFTVLLFFIGTYICNTVYDIDFSLFTAYSIIALFALINVITEWYFYSIKNIDPKEFMFKVIIIRGFKFLLYLILALVVIKAFANSKFYGLLVVVLFMFYTGIEILYFISKHKKNY